MNLEYEAREIPPEECFQTIKRDFQNKKPCAVLVGAGISIASGLPSGSQLKTAILDQVPVQPDDIKKNWLKHAHNDERFRVRLQRVSPEVIFTALSETKRGNIGLLMKAFQGYVPNLSHQLLVLLYLRGYWSSVATTNFDQLLEKALLNQPLGIILPTGQEIEGKRNILKLHGSCDVPDSQVVALFDFWRGSWNQAINSFINDLNGRNLVVCGYSGYDFDILIRLVHSEANKVYWLCQPSSKGFSFPELPALFEVDKLFRVECDIHDFIRRLGMFLSIADVGESLPRTKKTFEHFLSDTRDWGKTLHVSTWLEVCGTVLYELFEFPSSISLFEAAIRALEKSQADFVQAKGRLLRKISESHIQMGHYKEANEYASMSVNLLLENNAHEQIALDGVKSIRLLEKLERYDFAEEALRKLLPVFQQRRLLYDENIKEYIELVMATAGMFLRGNNTEGAEVALRHARAEAESLGSIHLYVDATFRLAQILMKSDKVEAKEEALSMAMEIYHLADLWGNLGVKHRAIGLIPYIYAALDRPEMAGKWLALTHKMADEVRYPEKMGRWNGD